MNGYKKLINKFKKNKIKKWIKNKNKKIILKIIWINSKILYVNMIIIKK